MSIASRITAMTEHIDDIYDTVELTGVDTTGVNKNLVNVPNTLKDGFVDIINNGVDTLYENFPKVSQTGEEPTLNGVYEAPMRVDLNGNTEQTTYTGKNLLPNGLTDSTNNGVTFTHNEDGTYLLNGQNNSSTANSTNYLYTGELNIPAGTYYVIPTGTNEVTITIRAYYEDSTNQYLDISTENTITILKNIVSANIYIQVRKNTTTTYNNFKVYPILSTTPVSPETYEPYVGSTIGNITPSPNPDYPQDIRVVKGNNTIKATGKNLFDKNNANILNAYISLGNSKITSSNVDKCLYIPIKSNTTYTISKVLSSRFVIGCTDELPVVNTTICNPISGSQIADKTYTITSGNNSQYLAVFYYATADTLTEQEILDSIQIEYGSTSTTYQPYQEQTYPLNLGTTELCKIGDYKDEIRKSTGKNLLNVSNSYSVTTNQDVNINLEPGNYTMSCDSITTDITSGLSSLCNFYHSDDTYDQIYFSHTNKVGQITITAPVTKVKIYSSNSYNNSNGKTTTFTNLMLEQGSQATDYEPYGKVWYKKGYIGKIVLDGSEANWDNNFGINLFTINRYFNDKPFIVGYGLSNYYKYNSVQSGIDTNTQNGDFVLQKYNDQYNLFIKNTNYNNVSDFKTWLSNNNTIVYYPLATPTYTEITDTDLINQLEDLKTAKSVEGQTNITQTNEELPFILDVSGLKKD